MDDREADVHDFSTSSSQHRLPTVTGVQALQNATAKAKGIPSGLAALDAILVNNKNKFSIASPGIQRGHVTEVFGPPGVGKTTFGLQAAVNSILSDQDESNVLWVNTGCPLVERRLEELITSYKPPPNSDLPSSPPEPLDLETLLDEKFTYLDAHTLARLLTVFLHPPPTLLSPKTRLIVVDDLSNILLSALSRSPKSLNTSAPNAVKNKLEKQATSVRFQMIESLGAAMSKMAALRNVAILVLTNATTSFQSSKRATLKPALSSQVWDSSIHSRIMLYRDFADEAQLANAEYERSLALRYAEVRRVARQDVFADPVPFTISADGIREFMQPHNTNQSQRHLRPDSLHMPSHPEEEEMELPLLPTELTQPSQIKLPTPRKKRKAFEIADSEDEEDDDALDSDPDEPKLPSMDMVSRTKGEEMILETHEMDILRRERYARVRGSEDEVPIPSSDAEEEDGVE